MFFKSCWKIFGNVLFECSKGVNFDKEVIWDFKVWINFLFIDNLGIICNRSFFVVCIFFWFMKIFSIRVDGVCFDVIK